MPARPDVSEPDKSETVSSPTPWNGLPRMSTRTLSTPASSPLHGHPAARTALDVPVLDQKPGRLGGRLAALPGNDHPVWTYVLGILFAVVAIASLSIVAGLLVTRVLLHVHGVAADDERFIGFLAHHRSSGLTDASLVGSTMPTAITSFAETRVTRACERPASATDVIEAASQARPVWRAE